MQISQEVESLDRIDAMATIIFDQNEPIDTPPIFNTVSYRDAKWQNRLSYSNYYSIMY